MKTEINLDSMNIVKRITEIDLFEDHLLRLRTRNNTAKSIIDFWGIPGIGKSTLMHEILEKSLADKYETIFVDFKELFYNAKKGSRLESRKAICAELDKKLFGVFLNHKTSVSSLLSKKEDMDDLSSGVVNKTTSYLFSSKNRFLVFLFDSVEYCRPDTFSWLEKSIFSPLASTKKVFIVLASQSQNKWQTFDVKQQSIGFHIQPFDPSLVRKQIGHDGVATKELANRIYEISFGVPACNSLVYKSLEKVYEQKGLTAAFSDSNKAKYVQREVKFFYAQTVHKLSPELKYVLKVISQLKWFDYALLREILVSTRPEIYSNAKASKFRDITRQLEETNYINWDIQNRGFAIDFTMRKILSLDLRLNHNLLFLQIQEIVLQWFKQLVDKYDSSYLFFLDLIYYRALYGELEPASSEIEKGINEIANLNISPLERISIIEQVTRLINETEYNEIIPSTYIEFIRKSSNDVIAKLLSAEN